MVEKKPSYPIMAKLKGPGPGEYMLPTTVGYPKHDFTKNRAPAYSLRLKTGLKDINLGPGPANANLNDYDGVGKANPKYTMRPYTRLMLPESLGPGPLGHPIHEHPYVNKLRPPAYTMGLKNGKNPNSLGPGPAQYMLPTTIGPKVPDKNASAAYTMFRRYPVRDNSIKPSPAEYPFVPNNIYKPRAPGYTMRPNTKVIGDRTNKPGPAEYWPDLHGFKPRPPKFSMGVKHSEYEYTTTDKC